jgi:hypothetical protein
MVLSHNAGRDRPGGISLRQELVMAEGRIKRWRQPSTGAVLYQVRLSLAGTPPALDDVLSVDYRVTGRDTTVQAGSTRRHAHFRVALWSTVPADVEATLSVLRAPPATLTTELMLGLPADDGGTYLDLDLRYAF